MKKTIYLILLAVVSLLLPSEALAKEYGSHPERSKYKFVVTDGQKLNVRQNTSTKAAVLTQLRPGDVVYVDTFKRVQANGYEWLPIEDGFGKKLPRTGYVTNLNRFAVKNNPAYVAPTVEDVKIEKAVESSQKAVKWVMFILAVGFAIWFICAYFAEDGAKKLLGERNNGMRRTFFFNIAPYRCVVYITFFLLCAVVASVLSLWVLGGAFFVLMWIVKIIALAVMWIGIIGCVLCIIATVCGAFPALIGVAIGGFIWYNDDKIERFADACSDTGLKFFNEMNVFGFTYDLIVDNWSTILTVICIPLVLFMGLAIIWLLFAGALIAYEKFITSRYNIKHPCPHCQQPSEPAIYYSKGPDGYEEIPNDVKLRPGMYGLFHITHPSTRERMPTMLMNGRDKMVRYCGNCGMPINAEEGTELHIALVGTAQSGKSTLSYRLMAEIFKQAGSDRVDFTDTAGSAAEKQMRDSVEAICRKERIDDEDLPRKTATNQTKSTQLVIKRKNSSIPYRLFINDVAGELFDVEQKDQRKGSTRFFRNADSILILLDPLTTDFSDCDTSEDYRKWLKEHDDGNAVKLRIRDIQDTVTEQIRENGNNPKKIHLNLVLPKIDLGYIPADVDTKDPEQLKAFLREEMGLGDLLHWAGDFKSVSVITVGATSKGKASNIDAVMETVVKGQLDIKL